MKNPISTHKDNFDQSHIVWGEDLQSKKSAFREISKTFDEYTGISSDDRTTAHSRYRNTRNLAPGISGRPGFTPADYYAFRPEEGTATGRKGILKQCDDVYKNVGIVNHIINLMAEFGCQGIKITHRDKNIEKFLNYWFKKVNGKDRSERFLNSLYRLGVVVVRKQTAKLTTKASDQLYSTYASPDLNISDIKKNKPETREIPWIYTFLNPQHVITVGGELSSFVGNPTYAIQLPNKLKNIINSPKGVEVDLVKQLPAEIIKAAKSNKPYVLPRDKTLVYHYKKDDWQEFALPMIFPILDDISLLEKLKLADMSALDGAISNIRIFKLGRIADKIAPSKAAAAKLANILSSHTGSGTLDIVWGDDISIEETKTEVYKFLGKTKYEPTYAAIHSGLGVPPILTGSTTGATNNYMSLKTLGERLQYGRDKLIEFWTGELIDVCEAMGFRFPANIEFDIMTLADEQAMKALCLQAVDRNLMSDEQIQTIFKQNPEMETVRLNREHKARQSGRRVEKSGPWHDPQHDENLQKIALQSGAVAPSQVGLNLQPIKKGEVPVAKMKAQQAKKSALNKKKGQPQQGRPKNSKDSKKRKTKTYKPKKSTVAEFWANAAQEKISEIVTPLVLEFNNKKSVRSLTEAEFVELELAKFSMLMKLEPMTEISEELVHANLSDFKLTKGVLSLRDNMIKTMTKAMGRELTVIEIRRIQATIYAIINGESENV